MIDVSDDGLELVTRLLWRGDPREAVLSLVMILGAVRCICLPVGSHGECKVAPASQTQKVWYRHTHAASVYVLYVCV